MSMKEKDVELAVVNGRWKMTHGNSSGDSEQTYPVLSFAKGSGPHLITFKLPTGDQNRFSATDPIWVSDNQKPTTIEKHEQIPDLALFDGRKTLVVLNKNSEEGTLYYRLNIEGPGGALDPEIKNGGEGLWGADTIALMIGAAVVVLLVGLWAGRMTAKR